MWLPITLGARIIMFSALSALPLEELSLLPAVRRDPTNRVGRVLYWERVGNQAAPQRSWKLPRSFH